MSVQLTEEQKQIMREWLAALRDPRAKQARGCLGRTDGSRCCLGVLSDLAAKHGVVGAPMAAAVGYDRVYYPDTPDAKPGDGNDCTALLNDKICGWAGVPTPWGFHIDRYSLSYWNDNGKSLAQIADMIEQHVFGPHHLEKPSMPSNKARSIITQTLARAVTECPPAEYRELLEELVEDLNARLAACPPDDSVSGARDVQPSSDV